MESWKRVWRQGVAPQLSIENLQALENALRRNDVLLIQGTTTLPVCDDSYPVVGCCPICYCGLADGLETVAEVVEFFARICAQCDELMGEPAAIGYFINWIDETPRDDMRRLLAAEIRRTLVYRLAPTEPQAA